MKQAREDRDYLEDIREAAAKVWKTVTEDLRPLLPLIQQVLDDLPH